MTALVATLIMWYAFTFSAFCVDRGVEYECRVSAKNSIDFGTPAVATIGTPEGGKFMTVFVKLQLVIGLNFRPCLLFI